ncbi:MAG TPA: hypothetical protein VML50_09335 [Anaeromyxobacter sp.]|nr:hypothetical protein [Anaeromyxobacter sp.]
MILIRRASPLAAVLVALGGAGCAAAGAGTGARPGARMEAPSGARAFGLPFGGAREDAERALEAAGVEVRPAPGDPDTLLADRCPGAPAVAPCWLIFGPGGLYAAQVEVPDRDRAALLSAVEAAMGAPARRAEPAPGGPQAPLATWIRAPWTVGVSRVSGSEGQATAVLRVEYDPAAPPVVAGVPLGRLRRDVEQVLDRQGATAVARDEGTTTYLGCPLGDPEVLSCVVEFRGGRAAVVTEVHLAPRDDRGALAAWRELAARLEGEVGRAPLTECPPEGPDRIGGDCTATWSTARLVVVAGAHRSAGAQHRGVISVYTSFAYPPLTGREADSESGAGPP